MTPYALSKLGLGQLFIGFCLLYSRNSYLLAILNFNPIILILLFIIHIIDKKISYYKSHQFNFIDDT